MLELKLPGMLAKAMYFSEITELQVCLSSHLLDYISHVFLPVNWSILYRHSCTPNLFHHSVKMDVVWCSSMASQDEAGRLHTHA